MRFMIELDPNDASDALTPEALKVCQEIEADERAGKYAAE